MKPTPQRWGRVAASSFIFVFSLSFEGVDEDCKPQGGATIESETRVGRQVQNVAVQAARATIECAPSAPTTMRQRIVLVP